jgi:hypothetical protein
MLAFYHIENVLPDQAATTLCKENLLAGEQ